MFLHNLVINVSGYAATMTKSSSVHPSDLRRQVFKVGRARLQAVTQGSGSPILLLHGAEASTLANGRGLYDRRDDSHTFIGVELPGAGDSRWQQVCIEVGALVQGLAEVVDALSPGQPIKVAGYLTGAVLANAQAAQLEDPVTHLAAAAPWLEPDPQLRLFFGLWRQLLDLDLHAFASFNTLVAFSNETLESLGDATDASIVQSNTPSAATEGELRKLIEMNCHADVSALAPLVTARTTVLSFEHDRMIPPRHARMVAERIRGSRLVSIGAGHAGPWEATQQFLASIRAALDLPAQTGDSL